jgi:hypothetical protein
MGRITRLLAVAVLGVGATGCVAGRTTAPAPGPVEVKAPAEEVLAAGPENP